jgi:hypothetical protein
MDANLSIVLGVFMRWLHITSVIAMLGGFIYARFVVAPVAASSEIAGRMAAQFRPMLYTTLATVLISGLYNYLTKPSYPPHYHMVIGIKFLFALHIFAAAVLYTLPQTAASKRMRQLTGLVISGLIVVLISADLRWMTMSALTR